MLLCNGMLYSLRNFMLWVYFYNYQRSLFWCSVFALATALTYLAYLSFFCLLIAELYYGCYASFQLESHVCKLIQRGSVQTCVSLMRGGTRLPYSPVRFFSISMLTYLQAYGVCSRVIAARWRLSHGEACLSTNSFSATYCDSGVWDTFLLICFDRAFRSILIFSLLPLSENSLVEKMGVKLFREFTQADVCSVVKKNLALGMLLRGVAHCLTLAFIFLAYTCFLTV